MNELRRQLKEGDPLAQEGRLSDADVERIRHYILVAQPGTETKSKLVLLAIAGILVLAAGVWVRRAELITTGVGEGGALPIAAPRFADTQTGSTLREFQFSTPGGTRMIWTFNPTLEVR